MQCFLALAPFNPRSALTRTCPQTSRNTCQLADVRLSVCCDTSLKFGLKAHTSESHLLLARYLSVLPAQAKTALGNPEPSFLLPARLGHSDSSRNNIQVLSVDQLISENRYRWQHGDRVSVSGTARSSPCLGRRAAPPSQLHDGYHNRVISNSA